jgi:hypothetical protein
MRLFTCDRLARIFQCAVKSHQTTVRTANITRERSLHPVPPGGSAEVTKPIKHSGEKAPSGGQGVRRP